MVKWSRALDCPLGLGGWNLTAIKKFQYYTVNKIPPFGERLRQNSISGRRRKITQAVSSILEPLAACFLSTIVMEIFGNEQDLSMPNSALGFVWIKISISSSSNIFQCGVMYW